MTRQKQFLKPGKTSKKDQPPETEDEYLAAGVKEEEGGEKWRAGDAAKSLRFFLRAIDIYDTGLRKHPSSFDLAYNKARLQFDVSQQPRLVAHLSQPVVELLFEALKSHQHALTIEGEDADALFNTAQVMFSIAELLADTSISVGAHDRNDAVPFLREVVQLFRKCYTVQRVQYGEAQTAMSLEPGTLPSPASFRPSGLAEPEAEEKWASVEETVTSSTLLVTILSELDAWTLLIPLSVHSLSLYDETSAHIDETFDRAKPLINGPEEHQTYEQARFNIIAALTEQSYKLRRISASEYAATLDHVWTSQPMLATFGPALADYSDALITLDAAIAADTSAETNIAAIRWTALSLALRLASTAEKNPGPVSRVKLNSRRGDIEILRARLGEAPVCYQQAAKSRAILLKNAETYYDGAAKLAALHEDTAGDVKTNMAKLFVVKGLQDGNLNERVAALQGEEQTIVVTVVKDMLEDDLVAL